MLSVTILTAICLMARAEFIQNPEAATVNEGGSVTLTCEESYHYNYRTSCSSYDFYWRRTTSSTGHREYLSRCTNVYRDFSDRMTVSKWDGRYTLTIDPTRPEDTGYYECYIYYNRDYIYTSENALLTVNALPRHEPWCEFYPLVPNVGTTVELRCRLSILDRPSLLTWLKLQSNETVPSEPTRRINPGDYFSVNFQITEYDNNGEFSCVVGQDLANGPRCTISPLQIPTNVTLTPSPSLTVSEGEVASFRCSSQSIPAAQEFRWRLRRDEEDIKVNMNTIQQLQGTYRLSDLGQDLEIVSVTTATFNNTEVRCIAVDPLESVSSEVTLLIVVPLETTTVTTEVMITTFEKGQTDNTSSGASPSTGIIVGSVFGVIFLLIVIAGLGFYIVKNKHKQGVVGARFQNSPGHERVGLTVVQASPTYEEVPQDLSGHDEQAGEAQSADDTVNAQSSLYATPDKARHEETEVGTSSPTYANSSGYVNLPRPASEEKRVSNGISPYAVPDKRETSRPEPVGGASESSEHKEDPKLKNVEGLVYADLDLQRPQATEEENEREDDSINYASIRGDMVEIRGLLNRE